MQGIQHGRGQVRRLRHQFTRVRKRRHEGFTQVSPRRRECLDLADLVRIPELLQLRPGRPGNDEHTSTDEPQSLLCAFRIDRDLYGPAKYVEQPGLTLPMLSNMRK